MVVRLFASMIWLPTIGPSTLTLLPNSTAFVAVEAALVRVVVVDQDAVARVDLAAVPVRDDRQHLVVRVPGRECRSVEPETLPHSDPVSAERAGEVERGLAVVGVQRAVRDLGAAVDDRSCPLTVSVFVVAFHDELAARRASSQLHRLVVDACDGRRRASPCCVAPRVTVQVVVPKPPVTVMNSSSILIENGVRREAGRRSHRQRRLGRRDRRRRASCSPPGRRGRCTSSPGSGRTPSGRCCPGSGSWCRTSGSSRSRSCSSATGPGSRSRTTWRSRRPEARSTGAAWLTPTVVPSESLL